MHFWFKFVLGTAAHVKTAIAAAGIPSEAYTVQESGGCRVTVKRNMESEYFVLVTEALESGKNRAEFTIDYSGASLSVFVYRTGRDFTIKELIRIYLGVMFTEQSGNIGGTFGAMNSRPPDTDIVFANAVINGLACSSEIQIRYLMPALNNAGLAFRGNGTSGLQVKYRIHWDGTKEGALCFNNYIRTVIANSMMITRKQYKIWMEGKQYQEAWTRITEGWSR